MVFEIMEKIKVAAGLNDPDDVPIDLTVVDGAEALAEAPGEEAPAEKPASNGRSTKSSKAARADVPADVES